jgi:hypothetical protein
VTPPACLVTIGTVYAWTASGYSISSNQASNPTILIPGNSLNPASTVTINLSVGFVGLTMYPFSKTFTTRPEIITADSGASGEVSAESDFSLTPVIRSNYAGDFI